MSSPSHHSFLPTRNYTGSICLVYSRSLFTRECNDRRNTETLATYRSRHPSKRDSARCDLSTRGIWLNIIKRNSDDGLDLLTQSISFCCCQPQTFLVKPADHSATMKKKNCFPHFSTVFWQPGEKQRVNQSLNVN